MPLTNTDVKPLPGIRGFLIDLDGVMYTGDTPVDGACEALQFLEEGGFSFRFVSNTTRKSRKTIAGHLQKMGLSVAESRIFTPAIAAAAHLCASGKGRIRLLLTGDAEVDFPRDFRVRKSDDPDAVVIGDAGDVFTYNSLNMAFRDLMQGADLIALEKDRYWMAQDGLSLSAGPFVSALEYATGKTATIVGKPSKAFFDLALHDMGLTCNQVVMIGDDILTDVGGAQRGGMRGVLVRTGKFRPEVLHNSDIRPDLVIDSIAQIQRIGVADLDNRWGMDL